MKGFSLLELSIVVVIIALLTAGATAGSQILQNAQIFNNIRQFTQTETAITNFKERYLALPGDFSAAHRYFDDSTDLICGTASECNGDGDEQIELGTKYESEIFRAWQHLNLAGLAKNDYSGIWGEGEYYLQGTYQGNFSLQYDELQERNVIKLGSLISISEVSDGAALDPETAEKFDLKLDDSNPLKGAIRAYGAYVAGDKALGTSYSLDCVEETNNLYNVAYAEPACVLTLLLD